MKWFFRIIKALSILLICFGLIYGMIRLYYATTGGFTISNITSDLNHDPRWETRIPSSEEQQDIKKALAQEYTYLGKGCQAYVFESEDKRFVIKFFKYQRFRPQAWIDIFTFIPAIKNYQYKKEQQKKAMLDSVFKSWKIAFEDLSAETGVVYLHLNKSHHLQHTLTIRDKIGLKHKLNLDNMEFLIQHKAEMLCNRLHSMIHEQQIVEASTLIDRLLIMLLSEYFCGYADNDHALMQNTGVWHGHPIHIDVGQLIYNTYVTDPIVYFQELYNKTYEFHSWLEKQSPLLAEHLRNRLLSIIGEEYFLKDPYVYKGNVAKIPHQDI